MEGGKFVLSIDRIIFITFRMLGVGGWGSEDKGETRTVYQAGSREASARTGRVGALVAHSSRTNHSLCRTADRSTTMMRLVAEAMEEAVVVVMEPPGWHCVRYEGCCCWMVGWWCAKVWAVEEAVVRETHQMADRVEVG